MPIPNLDDLTDKMDAINATYLGDLITYTAEGQAPRSFRAFVDYKDAVTDLGAGQAIEQDMQIEIPKASVPDEPPRSARITLPRRPGKTYYPTNPSTSMTGTDWICALKEAK